MMGQTFFPFHLAYLAFVPAVSRNFGRGAAIALAAGLLLATGLYIWIFYLCSRIKFAYLDIVVNREQLVAPAWRKYGPQSRRWSGFKILLGCIASALISVPMIAYVRHIMPLLLSINAHPQAQPPAQMFAVVFAGYGLIALFSCAILIVSGLLGDFIVPSLALEDTSLQEAFRRMFELAQSEPGEFALYALLKTVLGGAAYIGAMIAFEILIFIVILVVGLILALCGFLGHLAGVPSAILFPIGMVILFSVEMVLIVYGIMFSIGPVLTFLDAYAFYFLGGRYPLLGNLLDASEPPPVFPYPAYPPPGPFPPRAAPPPPIAG